LTDELALYNKLGDLHLKRGDVASAIEQYETAVNHYAEQGFPNNAIALCNKVLRNAPGRTHVYLKLAKLMMQRGFIAEAKQNLLEYAERMQKAGQIEDAFHALKEFADLSPDNEEIRLLLAEQLKNAARTDEAREQLAKLYHEVRQSGDTRRARMTLERMRAIDPDYQVEDAPTPQLKSRKQKSSDIVFIDLDEDKKPPVAAPDEEPEAEQEDQPFRVEPTSLGEGLEIAESEVPAGLSDVEHTAQEADLDIQADPVEQLHGLEVGEEFTVDADDVEVVEIEPTTLDEQLTAEDEPAGDGLSVVDTPPELGLDEDEIEEVTDLVAEEEEPPQVFVDGMGSATGGSETGDQPGEPLQKPDGGGWRGGADSVEPGSSLGLAGDEPIEAGVEVPDLDVEGFEGVPELDDVGEETVLADLPMIDVGDEAGSVADQAAGLEEPDDVQVEPEQAADAKPGDGADAVELLTEFESEAEEEEAEDVRGDDAAAAMPSAGAGLDIGELEAKVLDDPAAPGPHRELGETLIETGERERGLEELGIALAGFEELGDWRRAQSVAEVILRIEPNSVHHHQKRVEYSYRLDDRHALAAAYLELADALLRNGLVDRAQVVYRRVLEHDPGSDRARVALETLQSEEAVSAGETDVGQGETGEDAAAPPAAAASEVATSPAPSETAERKSADFVDLGALILEEEQARDTRMRIQHDEPTGDEERDFQIMLTEFKKGIDANIELDDTQAHYDLGVAFREMGLLDEAISEFQKALRGTQGRLRTAEALGLCFFDKGQFAVAATVLRRAVDAEPGGDDQKIGLLYWLGRCEEEQGRGAQALSYYQRIFSIDIGFQDVRERVKSLAQAGG
jgi:tetratricopeptide (TPR) repeat protein